MKKIFKSILAVSLCALLMFGTVAIGGDGLANVLDTFTMKASAAKITSFSTGNTFEFGWYPQTKETDSSIIAALNSSTGTWTSYNYYSGSGSWSDGQMKPSNYMRYKDVMYGATKYRGVVFDSYRPYCTGYTSSTSNTYQDDNGYTTGTTYWFKYEPIKWRVLDPATGLVLSDAILDSQAYNNYILSSGTDEYSYTAYWGDSAKTYYANNYAKSSIRQWLNNDFYNTAFSTSQQNIIQSTKLDNSAYSSSYSAYDSASTTDKIFLLSYSDTLNSNYGFSTSCSTYDTARRAQGSDYAKCQGLWVSTSGSYSGNSYWRLRSAGGSSGISCFVYYDGDVIGSDGTDLTDIGVRAALKLNLNSDIFQSSVSETGEGNGSGCGEAVTEVQNPKNSQTHSITDYASSYKMLKSMYLSYAAEPLDGSNGNPDICVPGLSKSDNMIPQGMTYWGEKNCILVSAYDENKKDASVIYGINASNGKFVAEYILNNEDEEDLATHVGGIAVSDNNLYITIGQKIGYISLATLRKDFGKSTTVKIEGRKSLADKLDKAALAYITYSDGYLYCGNFYHPDEEDFDDPASENYNSLILRYKLTETEDEWNELHESEPMQTLDVPNSIYKIQSAIYTDGKLIIRSSYGRANDSSLYVNDIDLSVNTALKANEFKCYKDLPMAEGMFAKDGNLYFLYESAAYKYRNGDGKGYSANPTDVVWKVNIKALTFSDYTRERTLYGKDYASKNSSISSSYLDASAKALDGNSNIDTLMPGLSDGMVPQAMTYMNYGGKEWILIGAYDSNGVNSGVIYAIDFNTGKYVAQFNVLNKNGTKNMGHMGGIAASSKNLYISDGIPGSSSTIGYVPLDNLVVDDYTNKNIYIADNIDIGSSMNNTYPAYLSYSNGELWTGNFYNSLYSEANYTTAASQINNTILLGYSLDGSSNEWATFKSNAQNSSYSHKVYVPDSVHSIQGCYITDDYCYLSMGTTVLGSTLYVFDIDLDRGKQFPLSSTPHNEYKNLNGAENIFVKDGYLYCAYESAAEGVNVFSTGGDKTDVIWKMMLGRDTIIDNRVYYGDSSYTTFTNSLENYINSTSSSTYSPDLARMLMTFSSSAYDRENLLSSLKNCGFKSASIEISENYDKQLEDEVGFAIASKTLSDGTKLVFIPVRGTKGAMEWASDLDVSTTEEGLHSGFANAMEAIYSELEHYFFGSIPTTNVKYVLTGHSRGAAVSNLLAWKLTQKGVSQSNIYSYNFACPDTVYVTGSKQNPSEYSCIFNINNANDLVSYVPGISCSVVGTWNKFGKSYWFKENGNSTKVDIGFSAHSNAGYTNFMGNKKSISEYMTFSQVKDWMESDKSVWESIKTWIFVGVYCPVSVEVVDVNGNVVATVIDGELQGTVKEGSMVFFRTDGDEKELIFPENKNYTVRIIGADTGTMDVGMATFEIFDSVMSFAADYSNVSVTEGKTFEARMYDDPYGGRLFVRDSSGTVTKEVSEDGKETTYNVASEFVDLNLNETVDYMTYVSISLYMKDIPEGYDIEIYKNGQLYTKETLKVSHNQCNIGFNLGNIKEDTNVVVKFVDKDGNYLKDINGNIVTKNIAKITCRVNFFIKLIAFFKNLFGTLPYKHYDNQNA